MHPSPIHGGRDGGLADFLQPAAGAFHALPEAVFNPAENQIQAVYLLALEADIMGELLIEPAFRRLVQEALQVIAALPAFLGEFFQLLQPRLIVGPGQFQLREPRLHRRHVGGGVLPRHFGSKIPGHVAVAFRRAQSRAERPNFQQMFQLPPQFAQFAFVGFEIAVARDHIFHRHGLAWQDKTTAEIVETFQVSERHRARQEALQHVLVEIQMAAVRHVAQVFAGRGKRAPATRLDERLEVRQGAGARLAILRGNRQEIIPLQSAGAKERGGDAVIFRRVAELETQPPGFHARAIRPGEFSGDVGCYSLIVKILRLAVFLALGVQQAVAFDRPVAAGAGGAAVEMLARFLRSYQDQHQQVHQDRLAGTGHAGQHQIAFHGQGIAITIPVQGMDF